MTRVFRLAPWAMAGVLVACAGGEHRLGGNQPEGGAAPQGGTGGANQAASDVSQGSPGAGGVSASPGYGEPNAAHSFAAGKWQGYIENYKRYTTSDAVLVEFDELSVEATTGKIVFGDPAAQLPDYSDPDQSPALGALGSPGSAPPEGYPFTLVDATFTAERLQFSVNTAEVWEGWCAQQQPIPDVVNGGHIYYCDANTYFTASSNGCYSVDPRTQTRRAASCGRHALCISSQTCRCTATACSTVGGGIHFDLTRRDSHLDGSVAGLADVLNVHLTEL